MMLRNLLAITCVCLASAPAWAEWSYTPTEWSLPTFSRTAAKPGTPEWWSKNKSKAEFVPGSGFRVEGVEGFFDDEGRPIGTKVSKVVKKESKGLLGDMQVAPSFTELKEQVGMGRDERIAQQAFSAGEDFFRREQYRNALKQFGQTIARWPDSQLEQDALFYKAECEFFTDNYPEATESYDRLLEKYPNTPHLDKVIRRQFDIARYWDQYAQYKPHWPMTPNLLDNSQPLFDTVGRAMKTYENIRLNDPTGPLADDAVMATANSMFLRGRYSDADHHYELIRQEYPHSEHQYEAHILGLQCKLQKYQGPEYDASPLDEAKKIVKQLKLQFGNELDTAERERLAEIEGRLNYQLALRDYSMAQHYDNTEYYGSAKYYYAKLMREFPGTPLAETAQARFTELGGKPDRPATKMEWFVNIFPENAERATIAQVPMLKDSDAEISIARQPETNSTADGATIVR